MLELLYENIPALAQLDGMQLIANTINPMIAIDLSGDLGRRASSECRPFYFFSLSVLVNEKMRARDKIIYCSYNIDIEQMRVQ